MTDCHQLDTLPAVIATDSYAVLGGQRRGTSVQLDGTYFTGQLRAVEALDNSSETTPKTDLEQRQQLLVESLQKYKNIGVSVGSLTEADLWTASTQFRQELQQIPEVTYLSHQFPGQCFVVPEWLQTGTRLHYGARVYFFQREAAPAPEAVLQRNIDAILNDSFDQFERYQGRLHGYPDCCMDFYCDRASTTPSPEWRSVEPFADRIDDEALGNRPPVSLDDVLPAFSEWDGRYGFFTREFFPEPRCETARAKGLSIYDNLSAEYSNQLIEDYFKLSFGYDYLVARAVQNGGSQRPPPGALGQEQLLFYLPLRELLEMPRY